MVEAKQVIDVMVSTLDKGPKIWPHYPVLPFTSYVAMVNDNLKRWYRGKALALHIVDPYLIHRTSYYSEAVPESSASTQALSTVMYVFPKLLFPQISYSSVNNKCISLKVKWDKYFQNLGYITHWLFWDLFYKKKSSQNYSGNHLDLGGYFFSSWVILNNNFRGIVLVKKERFNTWRLFERRGRLGPLYMASGHQALLRSWVLGNKLEERKLFICTRMY